MRIHLKLTANTQPVSFDHLPFLVGTFHKWLGENNIHGDLSLYSFSWLKGGKKTPKGLDFENGATWFISAYDDSTIKQLISGIRESSDVCFGMKVKEITIQETPNFDSRKIFSVNSPVLIKSHESEQKQQKHLSFVEIESDEVLTRTLVHKLERAGLDSQGVKVYFDRSYAFAKMKLVSYRGIGNRTNVCPVIVEGTPEQIGFAWNVGIGHSTGIGFGAII